MRLFRDLTLVVLVLGGAMGFSQVPRFVQEYEQRLGGALQEAQRQLLRYQDLSGGVGAPVDTLARRLAANPDPAVAGVGRAIAEQAGRAASLEAQSVALAGASRFRKPLVLLRNHDRELLAATWARYEFTFTLDLAFAAAGAVAGLLLNAFLWAVAGRLARPVRRRITSA
jgi:hypothetical protein